MSSGYSIIILTKPRLVGRIMLGAFGALMVFFALVMPGWAQTATLQTATIPTAPKSTASALMTPASAAGVLTLPAGFGAPNWNALTDAQKIALKPLTASWNNLSDGQKRKWISLSTNFPQLSPAEQGKLHERMAQWAALSPLQREQARLNFADAKQVTPQQKSEQWQAYQALSSEEKQKLAKDAQPKPPRTALAPQPVASDKINRLPLTKNPGAIVLPAPQTSAPNNTLLARPKPPAPPTVQAVPTPATNPASALTNGTAPQ